MSTLATKSPILRFFRWLFTWKTMRRLFVTIAVFVTVIALFRVEETWRGRRAWLAYKAELEAKGEVLDFEKLVPKAVPDEENFALVPLFASSFEKQPKPTWLADFERAQNLVSSQDNEK